MENVENVENELDGYVRVGLGACVIIVLEITALGNSGQDRQLAALGGKRLCE